METRSIDSPAAAAIGALAAIASAIALVSLRDVVDNANIALGLVLVVVVCGFFGGRFAGTGAAVGAALAFDFFHTQPYLHLRIDSSDDIVTTLLLLVIGLVAGQLSVRVRRRERAAAVGHSGVDRVWRVAELAARGADPEDITAAVRAELLSLLRLSACSFRPGEMSGLPVMAPEGAVPGTKLRYHDGGFELPADGFALPVHIGGRSFGQLICLPTPDTAVSTDEKHVAIVLADQLALVLAARSRPNATA